MTRRLLIVVVLLLAGAVVNAAVAWGCAVWDQPFRFGSGTMTLKQGLPPYFDAADRAFIGVGDESAAAYRSATRWGIGIRFGMIQGVKPPLWGAGYRASGFPVLCQEGWFVSFRGRGTMLRYASRRDRQRAMLVPLRPIWTGHAVNTVFYAVVLGLLARTLLALRHLTRQASTPPRPTPRHAPSSSSEELSPRGLSVLFHLLHAATMLVVTTVMAVVGLQLMGLRWHGLLYLWTIAGSILIWLPLSYLIRRVNIYVVIAIGLASPFLGAFVVAPPYSFIVVLTLWYKAVPVGIATALLIRFALRGEAKIEAHLCTRHGFCPSCRYDLRGSTGGNTCPECNCKLTPSG